MALKLVLGENGEGKTHLLYCLRDLALEHGYCVSIVEAKSAGLGSSSLETARAIAQRIEFEPHDAGNAQLKPLMTLLQRAVSMKALAAKDDGLDPDDIVPTWARGMRQRALYPSKFADALSKGLLAAYSEHDEALSLAVSDMLLEGDKFTGVQQDTVGTQLLRSIAGLPRVLGFRGLLLLIDEAETAVQKKGKNHQLRFLQLLRYVADHVAGGSGIDATVVIAVTPNYWPGELQAYEALFTRLRDPGRDRPEDRLDLQPRALARYNKMWVRETFRGTLAEFGALSDALAELAGSCLDAVDIEVARSNGVVLGKLAAGQDLARHLKRPFIKALCSLIDAQVDDQDQRRITLEEAALARQLARSAVTEIDSQEPL